MEIQGFTTSTEDKSLVAAPIPEFNVEQTKNEIMTKVKESPEVRSIVRQINIEDVSSIMSFGKNTAEEVSRFSDAILHSMQTTKVEDSGELLLQLNKIMDKFDIKDFEEKQPGFLGKMFSKAKNSVEALFHKYNSMGDEVDKVFVTLKQYEAEINTANKHLEDMFGKNTEYYEQLGQYIYAGQVVLAELKNNIIPAAQDKANQTGNQLDQISVNNLLQVQEIMEQRIYDLQLAENVAVQSMPTIKSIEYGNYNLVRKINSAFVITMPIFKQCLVQAIMLKRQSVQAKAMSALDEKTNELLLRNAENTALQSKMVAKLATGSSVSIETLEKSWQTIVKGIEETKAIQDEMRQKRLDGTKRLEVLKQEFVNRGIIR
ncbi:toxic anion resistance protein [Desulfosporosinus sp. PR]|uniref:toxic anion resistance protein n=1 Tax=Candidatus Desulfosporosinus nitrosoreducens TaxID=3401928 RepID=UPI0027FBDEF5|nr:toxic anion resistance protein [Desulfosporosinus sp. PR]MDQ7092417.1 toxic anion resistance protein [Desulfosporosinus sp. PR]